MTVISVEDPIASFSAPFDFKKYKNKPGNVLVVSPHPDDDVIGAGGTMSILSGRGLDVFSLYITDGSSAIFNNNRVHLARQQEALDALQVVRARGAVFLRHKSRQLRDAANRSVIQEIREVIKYFMPEIVYVTSPFEKHMTHMWVTEMTVKAIRQIRAYRPKLWGYSVWGGIFGLPAGADVVDITQVVRIKRKAIRKHKSQLQYKAYDAGIIGRNKYEGIFLETHNSESFQFAETFLNMQELVSNKRLSLKAFSNKALKGFPF